MKTLFKTLLLWYTAFMILMAMYAFVAIIETSPINFIYIAIILAAYIFVVLCRQNLTTGDIYKCSGLGLINKLLGI